MRELVAQHHVRVTDLVAPLFVREGVDEPEPIASLPGVVQHSRESLRAEVASLAGLGVTAVILFGVQAAKDATGSGAYDPDGIVQVALRDLRSDLGDDVVVMADLCVDEYTDHGHCGIVGDDGTVDNDATLSAPRAALAQAEAGAQVVAPSGMMDGQVAVIRRARRRRVHGRRRDGLRREVRDRVVRPVPPMPSTCRSSGAATARATSRTGAMPARPNSKIELDIAEGADIVMVNPALAYLDVIAEAAARVDVPLAAYHVSGEYHDDPCRRRADDRRRHGRARRPSPPSSTAGADVLTYFTRWFAESVADGRIAS